MMRFSLIVVFVVLASLCHATGVPPTQDQWNAAIQKAKDYLTTSAFTNAEKSDLATGVGWEGGQCVGNIPAIPRVNFTGFCLEDSPTGVRFAQKVTGFPAAVNAAATWNRSLIYDRYAAFGSEFKVKGAHIALAPMMNMGRVAAGGRNWEGFGADPYLTGECAYLAVIGIQDQGVIATSKHFLLNEQEHFRTTSSSNADVRTMHEVYLWPFRQAVKAGTGSVMCSYNLVNGFYACENEYILSEVLKKEFGFQGYIMSDWAATMSGLPSVLAGLDMTMPGDITFNSGTTYFGANLVDFVTNGSVTQERLDDMAIRILTPYFLLGQDQGYPTVDFDFRDPSKLNLRNAQADHATIVRTIGAESNILLKNINNTLPFTTQKPDGVNYTFAVIGSDAGPSPGNFGPTACGDHGCDNGTLAQGWGSGTVWFPYLIDPNAAIVNQSTMNGQTVISSLTDTIADAQQAAAQASIAIVFANADSGEDYITVEGNEGDRNNLNLFHNGNELIQAVASVNNRTVVVLHVVGPVVMPWADHPNVTAIILAGLPGQESGNSLVDTLWGAVNPSAKLVYTIGKLETDYGAKVLYTSNLPRPQINYTEALLIDYRWFDQKNITPQYEFGFGLSYTTFSYANLKFNPVAPTVTGCAAHQALEDDVVFSATVDVTNTGAVAGAEVVQLYLGFPESAGEPPKVLRGFDKVLVSPSGTATASFSLNRIDISIWDPVTAGWVVPAGTFQVMIGASSRDIRLTTTFDIAPVPTVTLSVDTTVAEGATLTATLTLSTASTSPISVPVLATDGTAMSGVDYSLGSTCATFAPGVLTASISITIIDDNVYRGDTKFQLSLLLPNNANLVSSTPITILIQDNDLPQLSVAASSQTISVSEAAGTVNITLQLSKQSVFPTNVNWTLSGHPNLNDIMVSNAFVIPPLATSIDIPVQVLQDTIYEGNETFILTLSSATNSTISTTANVVSFTVIDDDTIPYVYILTRNAIFTSSAPVVSFDIALSNPEEGEIDVVLQVNYINVTNAVVAFTNGFPNVVIPTNTYNVTVDISSVYDSIYEGNQVFTVSIANITAGIATIGSTNSVDFTIQESIPLPSVYFPQTSYAALQANVTTNITISLTNAANKEIIVPYTLTATSLNGSIVEDGYVTFPALATSEQISIFINGSWTAPATLVLDTPTAGPVQLGSANRFTIYNNFTHSPTTPPTTGIATTGIATTGNDGAGMSVPILWLALLVVYHLL